MSCKSLTQSSNISLQLQLFITSKVFNSLEPYRSGQNIGPDLGLNCLKLLSADDNVMLKFKSKSKYIDSISTCHNF